MGEPVGDLAGPDPAGRDDQALREDGLERADEPRAPDVCREHLGGAMQPGRPRRSRRGEGALDEDGFAAPGDLADLGGWMGEIRKAGARVQGGLGLRGGGHRADADEGGAAVRVRERGGPGDGFGPAGGGGGQLDRAAAGGEQGGCAADGLVGVGVAQHRQQALGGYRRVRVAGQGTGQGTLPCVPRSGTQYRVPEPCGLDPTQSGSSRVNGRSLRRGRGGRSGGSLGGRARRPHLRRRIRAGEVPAHPGGGGGARRAAPARRGDGGRCRPQVQYVPDPRVTGRPGFRTPGGRAPVRGGATAPRAVRTGQRRGAA